MADSKIYRRDIDLDGNVVKNASAIGELLNRPHAYLKRVEIHDDTSDESVISLYNNDDGGGVNFAFRIVDAPSFSGATFGTYSNHSMLVFVNSAGSEKRWLYDTDGTIKPLQSGGNLGATDSFSRWNTLFANNLDIANGIPGTITWSEVTSTPETLSVNKGYYANHTSRIDFPLPATAAKDSIIRIVGRGTGGWKISQATGQTIDFGNIITTSGATGFLQSTHERDCVELICVIANTKWQVISSVGNLEYS